MYEGIKNINQPCGGHIYRTVITEEEALLLRAKKTPYKCALNGKEYKAGQKWMIRGPLDFIADNDVEIMEKR